MALAFLFSMTGRESKDDLIRVRRKIVILSMFFLPVQGDRNDNAI